VSTNKYLKYKTKYLSLKRQIGGDLIQTQISQLPTSNEGHEKPFYLLSYGSNSLEQLAERLKIDKESIRPRLYPVKLNNYSRGFFSYSNNLGGSVATIYGNEGGTVFGIALKLFKYPSGKIWTNGVQVDLRNLMDEEQVNQQKYKLEKINNLILDDNTNIVLNNCYAFIGNLNYDDDSLGLDPSIDYLETIANMIKDRRELKNEVNIYNPVEIDIRVYKNNVFEERQKKTINFEAPIRNIRQLGRLEYTLTTGLVEAIAGNVPIIITAPHGGTIYTMADGQELEKRTAGQRISDFKTDELTVELKKYLENNSNIRPYYIIANFHREYVDANRRVEKISENERINEDGAIPTHNDGKFYLNNIKCYNEYHKAITETIDYLHRQNYQKILLLDIHGQGYDEHKNSVILGTLCRDKCPNARQNMKTTIDNDKENIQNNFIEILSNKIHPAFTESGRNVDRRNVVEITERNFNTFSDLSGGWTIRKYYNIHNKVNTIQLEHGKGLRLEPWQRVAMAKALGESIKNISEQGYKN